MPAWDWGGLLPLGLRAAALEPGYAYVGRAGVLPTGLPALALTPGHASVGPGRGYPLRTTSCSIGTRICQLDPAA
jgi:hypothetical protein